MVEKIAKKNADYSASAVMLTNPPQVMDLLIKFKKETSSLSVISEAIDKTIPKELKDQRDILEKWHIETANDLRKAIDEFGSYQDTEKGEYAVKQKRESITYQAVSVRCHLPEKLHSLVLIESVDVKALDGLVKGGIVTPEQARQCGEIKETYAYIIK